MELSKIGKNVVRHEKEGNYGVFLPRQRAHSFYSSLASPVGMATWTLLHR